MKHIFTIYLVIISVWCTAQTEQHYYILFSARAASLRPFSIGGHAFVTWRSEDSALQKVEQFTYGFFPKKGTGLLHSVDGAVVAGYVKNSRHELLLRRFIIEVDSVAFAETLRGISLWQTQSYSLIDNNCVDFMNDIALRVGLITPDTQLGIFPKRPSKYIKKLKKMNHDRIIKNAYLRNVRLRMLRKAESEDK